MYSVQDAVFALAQKQKTRQLSRARWAHVSVDPMSMVRVLCCGCLLAGTEHTWDLGIFGSWDPGPTILSAAQK